MIIIALLSLLFMSSVIATFNANGIRQTYKRKAVFHYLKQKKYDVILLQETHSTSADENL